MHGLKDIRLPMYDYRADGFYFVTFNTRFRHPFFSRVSEQNRCASIFRCTARQFDGVSIDTMVVMPDHVHLILVLERQSMILGEVVRRMKARVSYEFDERIWQPNYYEHVIRNEFALDNIRRYIISNPEKKPRFRKRDFRYTPANESA